MVDVGTKSANNFLNYTYDRYRYFNLNFTVDNTVDIHANNYDTIFSYYGALRYTYLYLPTYLLIIHYGIFYNFF